MKYPYKVVSSIDIQINICILLVLVSLVLHCYVVACRINKFHMTKNLQTFIYVSDTKQNVLLFYDLSTSILIKMFESFNRYSPLR